MKLRTKSNLSRLRTNEEIVDYRYEEANKLNNILIYDNKLKAKVTYSFMVKTYMSFKVFSNFEFVVLTNEKLLQSCLKNFPKSSYQNY